jgi:hypothetical protein
MLRALIGFLCVCFSLPSQAKLGETLPQLIQRFGKSYTIESDAIGKGYRFRSEKLSVDVLVANGVSVSETYFSEHPLTNSGEPPNDIVRAILKGERPLHRVRLRCSGLGEQWRRYLALYGTSVSFCVPSRRKGVSFYKLLLRRKDDFSCADTEVPYILIV